MATQAVKNSLYRWEGTDRNGIKTSGQITAEHHTMIRIQLRRQGITVSKIRRHYSHTLNAGKSVTALDITLFTRQLATLISAGIALQQALEVIANGFEGRAMRQQVSELQQDIGAGTSWEWDMRAATADITPLLAATAALRALDATPVKSAPYDPMSSVF